MNVSIRTQCAVSVMIILGAAYFVIFDAPFIALIVFVLLCVSWSAWCLISIFRGPDEVEQASVRYALAFASGIGVPLSLAGVLLMVAVPAIQSLVTVFAASARHGLGPAAAGFAMGIAFAILMLSFTFCAGLMVWWTSKR